LNDSATAYSTAIGADADNPACLNVDALRLGELMQLNPTLTSPSGIAPNHSVVTGRCAVGVP
jgi:hypothetical protein